MIIFKYNSASIHNGQSSVLKRHNNVASHFVQPKLKINTPNDRYEQEADRIADRAVNMPFNAIDIKNYGDSYIQKKPLVNQISRIRISTQRKCSQCEEEEGGLKQRKESNSCHAIANQSLMSNLQSTRGKGQQMNSTTNTYMSSRFGVDFSSVRIHNDNRAAKMSQSINAKAFTIGNDIYFNSGAYQPQTSEGKRLLAHELVHTVQQKQMIFRKENDAILLSNGCRKTTEIETPGVKGKYTPIDMAQKMYLVNRGDSILFVHSIKENGKPISENYLELVPGESGYYYPSSDAVEVGVASHLKSTGQGLIEHPYNCA